MPDAKDNTKLTGDTHPPEVADGTGRPQAQQPTEGAYGQSPDDLGRDLENESRAGKGINQAGDLKDRDAPGAGHDKPRGQGQGQAQGQGQGKSQG